MTIEVKLRNTQKHPHQHDFIYSAAKRKAIRAGRRGGKTVGSGTIAAEYFLKGKRVLYAAPTEDQIAAFWFEVKRALAPLIDKGVFIKNETIHSIERPGTKQRIRAKTAWNADTLRGDYADLLILDEFQLMAEDALELVGLPMLADNNGDLVVIYTPPSLSNRTRTKADDPQYAAKLFRKYKERQDAGDSKYAVFHFSSYENPFISKEALTELSQDMTSIAYRMEILAEDIDEAPGALWTRKVIENHRREYVLPTDMQKIVVGVDPAATSEGDETGIVICGRIGDQYFVFEDSSLRGSPQEWATKAVGAYHKYGANCIVAESNQGGEMVAAVLKQIDNMVPIHLVHASRGKQTRAEPVAALYEQGKVWHVGNHPMLEDQMTMWLPGNKSPDRMDALVWAITELMENKGGGSYFIKREKVFG